MSHIAVFGCGFVGGTVANFLQTGGINVTRIDPKFGGGPDPHDAIADSDGIIICVPTPMGEDGSCDDSIVRDVLAMTDHRTRVLLKSTVIPSMVDQYSERVVYNPEFLRERHAAEDFRNQTTQIFGHHPNNKDDAVWWASLFGSIHNPGVKTVFTDRTSASMIKYVHNAWLATKVAWFHELYSKMPQNANYADIIDTLAQFENIGPSHMQAPNHEGGLGYSGACFPKDVSAMLKEFDLEILSSVHAVNGKLKQ